MPASSFLGWMQSTGQASTQAVSLVPIQGSAMTYAISALSGDSRGLALNFSTLIVAYGPEKPDFHRPRFAIKKIENHHPGRNANFPIGSIPFNSSIATIRLNLCRRIAPPSALAQTPRGVGIGVKIAPANISPKKSDQLLVDHPFEARISRLSSLNRRRQSPSRGRRPLPPAEFRPPCPRDSD
jgi:hypothetical protein